MKNTLSPKALRAKLRRGPFKFSFEKKDGTLREAYGTLNMELIPESNRPKTDQSSSPMIVPFYDLEKGAWRSVSAAAPVFE